MLYANPCPLGAQLQTLGGRHGQPGRNRPASNPPPPTHTGDAGERPARFTAGDAWGPHAARATAASRSPCLALPDKSRPSSAQPLLQPLKPFPPNLAIAAPSPSSHLSSPVSQIISPAARSLHCPLSSLHCPLSSLHCPVSSLHCPLSSLHCPLPSLHCPLSSLHCPLSSLHCPLSSLHCP
eukprot:361853-Chlamydomonas_euryale.AAC.1